MVTHTYNAVSTFWYSLHGLARFIGGRTDCLYMAAGWCIVIRMGCLVYSHCSGTH